MHIAKQMHSDYLYKVLTQFQWFRIGNKDVWWRLPQQCTGSRSSAVISTNSESAGDALHYSGVLVDALQELNLSVGGSGYSAAWKKKKKTVQK